MARIEDLLVLVQRDPHNSALRFVLGTEYVRAAMYAEATEAFDETVRIRPNYSAAYRELGQCLIHLGQTERAREILTTGKQVAAEGGDRNVGQEIDLLLRSLTPELPG